MVWYKNPVFLSLSIGLISAAITALTPYQAAYPFVGLLVYGAGLAVAWLKEEEGTITTTVTAPDGTVTTTITTVSSSPSSAPTPPSTQLTIKVSPASFSASNGVTLTIAGANFPANSRGYISDENTGIQIASYTVSANGTFRAVATYQDGTGSEPITGLANAVLDEKAQGEPTLEISAYNYATDTDSNAVSVPFS